MTYIPMTNEINFTSQCKTSLNFPYFYFPFKLYDSFLQARNHECYVFFDLLNSSFFKGIFRDPNHNLFRLSLNKLILKSLYFNKP